MKSYLPDYVMINPFNLTDALNIIAREPDKWTPFAGGTDIMVLLEAGKLKKKFFINLHPLQELHFFEETASYIRIGAMTTYTMIRNNRTLTARYPLLSEAARLTASIGIQNRGTIGGNIANASPAADSAPVLLVYDADIELISKDGIRIIPYKEFHTGYKKTRLEKNEIILAFRLPKSLKSGIHFFRKVGGRNAMTISKLCFAGRAELTNKHLSTIHIALGSIAPVPLLCKNTEDLLQDKQLNDSLIKDALAVLAAEIAPIDDMRSTKTYRLKVAQNLLKDFLMEVRNSVGLD